MIETKKKELENLQFLSEFVSRQQQTDRIGTVFAESSESGEGIFIVPEGLLLLQRVHINTL